MVEGTIIFKLNLHFIIVVKLSLKLQHQMELKLSTLHIEAIFRSENSEPHGYNLKILLTLYVPCIILQCVDDQRNATLLMNNFYSTFFLALHVLNSSFVIRSSALVQCSWWRTRNSKYVEQEKRWNKNYL